MQNLEFARDLQNQFRNFVTEEDRQVKKKAKKEGAERAKAETARLATILTFQKILAGLVSNSKAKDDLKKGENGAKKLSKDQLDDFDELLKITNINLDDTEKVEIVVEWVMKSQPFWIKNLPYIPHIMNDSNGRFGDKKEWKLLSVPCSLWGIYGRENWQCVFFFYYACAYDQLVIFWSS